MHHMNSLLSKLHWNKGSVIVHKSQISRHLIDLDLILGGKQSVYWCSKGIFQVHQISSRTPSKFERISKQWFSFFTTDPSLYHYSTSQLAWSSVWDRIRNCDSWIIGCIAHRWIVFRLLPEASP